IRRWARTKENHKSGASLDMAVFSPVGRTAGAADASLAVLSFIRRIAVAIMPCVDTMAPHTIAIAIHCQEHTMQALPIPTDTDPQETREWLESLQSVVEADGRGRAHFLIDRLLDFDGALHGDFHGRATTPYVNTIPAERQLPYPGDLATERRLSALVRHGHGAARRPPFQCGRPHCHLCVGGGALRRGLRPFLPRPHRDARRRHGVYPGPFGARYLCARLSGRPAQRGPAGPLPPRSRRRGPVVLSASAPDAGLLGSGR